MSRLIDADALKKDLDAWARVINKPKYYVREEALYIIDAMPTIEPKRGEWVRVEETRAEWRCSNCNDVIGLVDSAITPTDADIYFCPNCGADMREAKK